MCQKSWGVWVVLKPLVDDFISVLADELIDIYFANQRLKSFI